MNKFTVYTDAGCARGKGGFAFLFRSTKKIKNISLGTERADYINTKLFSIKPIGLNTELVESQTSYISRLADAHCVSVGTLVGKELAPRLCKDYLIKSSKNGGSRFYEFAVELNGFGKQAEDFANVLSEMTGITSVTERTFLP
jgi:hypothetical protein